MPQNTQFPAGSDGLCGRTDEDNLGFTCAALDKYIRTGVCGDKETREIIDRRRLLNRYKLEVMPAFRPDIKIKAKVQ